MARTQIRPWSAHGLQMWQTDRGLSSGYSGGLASGYGPHDSTIRGGQELSGIKRGPTVEEAISNSMSKVLRRQDQHGQSACHRRPSEDGIEKRGTRSSGRTNQSTNRFDSTLTATGSVRLKQGPDKFESVNRCVLTVLGGHNGGFRAKHMRHESNDMDRW